jgi:uncharacterized protein (TIGR02646 family)
MQVPLAAGAKRAAFPFKAYKADEVKQRLEALFHGKCAYCESYFASQAPVDVEHYRPKGAVEGEPNHPGYWWLAMEWTNLLPSCLDCNRRRRQMAPSGAISDLKLLYAQTQSGKKDSFPIAGPRAAADTADLELEKPLLLDPTRDNPADHLTYCFAEGAASGLILPKATALAALPTIDAAQQVAAAAAQAGLSVKGAVSIQVYGLNRMHLVQERARLVQRLRFMESMIVSLGSVAQALAKAELGHEPAVKDALRNLRLLQGRILAEMQSLAAPEAPFSALATTYLVEFKKRVASLP